MRRSLLAALCVVDLASACRRPQRDPTASVDPEDLVHRAALAYEAEHLAAGAPLRVFARAEPRYSSEADAQAAAAGPSPLGFLGARVSVALQRAYVLANVRERSLHLPRRLAGRRVVASDAGPPDLPAALQYVHFLSRAGFSQGGDSALVQVSQICGPLCGSSALLLVVRGAGGWRVERPVSQSLH